jgi:hypothetical protein
LWPPIELDHGQAGIPRAGTGPRFLALGTVSWLGGFYVEVRKRRLAELVMIVIIILGQEKKGKSNKV